MLFSVIIPVYNVETYLPRCIDSVLKQTYRDYEILLIDDGSEDASGKICDEYARRYELCQVVHQANAGLASARNAGLDRAQGKYIVFLDADDTIEKELLMKVGEVLERQGYDLCSFAARRIAEDGSLLYEMQFEDRIRSFDFTTEDRLCFLLLDFLQYKIGWEAWFFVYRRAIIEERHLRFREEIAYAEDLVFTFHYMLYTKNLLKLPDILYNYTYREDSITAKETCKAQIQGMFDTNYVIMRDLLGVDSTGKQQQDLKVLLYAAMLLYFLPQYSKECSGEEIREILLSCTDAGESWRNLRKRRKILSSVFSEESVDYIFHWVEGK